jgi:hypothetical protein
MSRIILALVAVGMLCMWAIGCSEDSPSAPQPTPGPTTGTVVVNPSPDSLACSWQLTGPSSQTQSLAAGGTVTFSGT